MGRRMIITGCVTAVCLGGSALALLLSAPATDLRAAPQTRTVHATPRPAARRPQHRNTHKHASPAAPHPAKPVVRRADVDPARFDPSVPSARVVIPRLGVDSALYERGVDPVKKVPDISNAYRALTHFHFSAAAGQPGNDVIYGHDDIYGNVFQNLPSMRIGDRVYIYQNGRRYIYRVTGSKVVDPYDVAVLDPTAKPTLTLISCVPFGVDSQRIVVTATLIGSDRHA